MMIIKSINSILVLLLLCNGSSIDLSNIDKGIRLKSGAVLAAVSSIKDISKMPLFEFEEWEGADCWNEPEDLPFATRF